MPLSEPPERRLSHLRDITLRGYERADGLFDIEAQITDTKTYVFVTDEIERLEPGDPLHGMSMRMTVDEGLRIIACEAVTDHAPYATCPGAAPNFARLAGLVVGRGFMKEAMARVGGTQGCTHLRELLQQMATVAFQTVSPVRAQRRAAARGEAATANGMFTGQRGLVGSCLAYASDGPVVQRRWPDLYTGADATAASQS